MFYGPIFKVKGNGVSEWKFRRFFIYKNIPRFPIQVMTRLWQG